MKIIRKVINKIKFLFRVLDKNEELLKESNDTNSICFDNVELINSTIGEYSYIAKNSIVHNTSIGKFCSIGPNVVIGYGEHPKHLLSTSPVFYTSKSPFDIRPKKDVYFGHQNVIIENDVWIGANVFIKNGLKIGNGAIIGAGAVVLKDVDPYTIVVGVPAIQKSKRFPDDVIEKLLKLEWWAWDPKYIMSNIDILTSDSIIEEMDSLFDLKRKFFNEA